MLDITAIHRTAVEWTISTKRTDPTGDWDTYDVGRPNSVIARNRVDIIFKAY
jgi:hypothetical protein